MTIHRFFCENLETGSIELSPEEAKHASAVLRLQVGDSVLLFDGKGRSGVGNISFVSKKRVEVEIDTVNEVSRPSPLLLTVFTAIPRTQRQPFLFEKCTEMGVARICPTIYERSTVKPKKEAAQKWLRTSIEASKQSGCLHLPIIDPPRDLPATLAGNAPELRLVASTGEGSELLPNVLNRFPETKELAVWIGPEGGISELETKELLKHGAIPVSLGPQILRIETAVLAVACGGLDARLKQSLFHQDRGFKLILQKI